MSVEQTVYIVDDEVPIRKALRFLAKSERLKSKSYDSAQAFVDDLDNIGPGCLLLDVCMPGMSGLELQKILSTRKVELPMIIITGHADVPTAVQALKGGACDFIEKPFDAEALLESVQNCLKGEAKKRCTAEWRKAAYTRLARLTPREKQVMNGLATGRRNKQIAETLFISSRTVELHRASLMEKLEAKTLSDVVRVALLSESEE